VSYAKGNEMTGEKILIVDDDPDIRDVLTLVLETQGYEIKTARDGIECFERLNEEKPDLGTNERKDIERIIQQVFL